MSKSIFKKVLATGLLSATLLSACSPSLLPTSTAQQSKVRFSKYNNPNFKTPNWVKDAVFYQIFPERFKNGNKSNDPPGSEPWGSKPKLDNYMGGDLDGVIQELPYLKKLGVNAIYFNPIFEANSNHKYNTINYMKIDPAFGDINTFKTLINKAHGLGIKVVLDAVLNHSGYKHWMFQDAVKNGPKSQYWDWYNIYSFPVVTHPKPNYDSWWGHYTLPKWNVDNQKVRDHLYKITEYWTKQGIDGWRLDVPNEIADHNFWRKYRDIVKGINPEAYIVGEIWGDASPWLKGDQFDAVMNYVFRDAVLNFFIHDKINVDQFDWNLQNLRKRHPAPATNTMFNIVGSHDTERIRTLAGDNMDKVKLAAFFQMTYLGAPVIYYGDEIGMAGGKDPDDRRTFIWDKSKQNHDLKNYYQKLIALRKKHPSLRQGNFRSIRRHNDDRTFAYIREFKNDKTVMVLNNSDQPRSINIDARRVAIPDGTLKNLMNNQTIQIKGGQVTIQNIPPRTGMMFQLNEGNVASQRMRRFFRRR